VCTGLIAIGGALATGVTPVHAQTFTVSTTNNSGAGSLRQAIIDANAAAGADVIDLTGVTGTITLASALPTITSDITINGPGQANLTISGNDVYRVFDVNTGTFTLNNVTVSHGGSALLYVTNSTVNATNVTFRDMTTVDYGVYNNGAGAVSTYTGCTFRNMIYGVGSDNGSTPATSSTETDYTNRTYIVNSTFLNNTGAGIFTNRFTKVSGSTFTNNTIGASIGGSNRSTILSSTFSNNGVGIYGNANLTTPGTGFLANNRLIDGNTFTNNTTTAISIDDGMTNGQKSQIWSTIINNVWDGNNTWIQATKWDSGTSSNITITKTSLNTSGNEWTESANTLSSATTTSSSSSTTSSSTTSTTAATTTTAAATTTVAAATTTVASSAATTTTTSKTAAKKRTSATTPSQAAPATLPQTGRSNNRTVQLAMLFFVFGIVLVVRRRVA
jgi:hypothetical protein